MNKSESEAAKALAVLLKQARRGASSLIDGITGPSSSATYHAQISVCISPPGRTEWHFLQLPERVAKKAVSLADSDSQK